MQNPNKKLPQSAVIDKLPSECHQYARKVGKWLWLEFPGKPAENVRKTIKELGFFWNKKRSDEGKSTWCHPCGHNSTYNRRIDPRDKYGEIPLADDKKQVAFA